MPSSQAPPCLRSQGERVSISFIIKWLDVGNEDKEEKAKAAEKQGYHICIWPSGNFQPKTLQYLEHIIVFVNFPLLQGQTPAEKLCHQEDYSFVGGEVHNWSIKKQKQTHIQFTTNCIEETICHTKNVY